LSRIYNLGSLISTVTPRNPQSPWNATKYDKQGHSCIDCTHPGLGTKAVLNGSPCSSHRIAGRYLLKNFPRYRRKKEARTYSSKVTQASCTEFAVFPFFSSSLVMMNSSSSFDVLVRMPSSRALCTTDMIWTFHSISIRNNLLRHFIQIHYHWHIQLC
jgi:hypothetical protein